MGSNDHGGEPPKVIPRVDSQRVLKAQLLLAVTLGSLAFVAFCFLRSKWPQFYAARRARRKGLPLLPDSMFGWLKALYNITEDQVLEHAGLDAYVFLGFFKMAIQLFSICTVCALTIIGPIRLHFTGRYDPDGDDDEVYHRKVKRSDIASDGEPTPEDYEGYLWVYVVFTYVFTALTATILLRFTMKVIRIRQEYLGRQNSITDRTIRLAGIPHDLRTPEALKEHVESLSIGNVRSVSLCRDWETLDKLFDERDEVIAKLERAWCEYLGPTWANEHPGEQLPVSESRASIPTMLGDNNNDEQTSLLAPQDRRGSIQIRATSGFIRPHERQGFGGLFGSKYDVLDEYTQKLEVLDEKIRNIRQENGFTPTGSAFLTMDSVSSAQMTGQAVLDPRPHKLIAETAPAPHDVVWRNMYMTTKERLFRTYSISVATGVFSVFMVAVVGWLAAFLQYDSIEKYLPALAKVMQDKPWVNNLITGLLPPWLFSLLTSVVPFAYSWLSIKQGAVSYGEIELSTISKNFFFLFFNMFIVFTAVSGAISSYWKFLKDTTQIAYELARTLRGLSLLYVNLIMLQGLGMMPFRLLQIGGLSRFPFIAVNCKSPRDHRNMYKPQIFNYGIILPQPLLIFIIVLLYSVISIRILPFGTIYFVFGYFAYKYQLIYSMVHPQHSTGRAWPLIFRRVALGLVMFHLAMAGILALQHAYFLATMLTPLPFIIFGYWYNFEENYVPLLQYIALRAIETTGSGTPSESVSQTSSPPPPPQVLRRSRSQSKTLDEQREQYQRYTNPNMVRPLDGPWIGVEGDEVILANSSGTVRKRMRFAEWE